MNICCWPIALQLALLFVTNGCVSEKESDPFAITTCEKNYLKDGTCPYDRGCAWHGERLRSIERDGRCAAFSPAGAVCIEAGESVNNGTMQLYRLVDGHTEYAYLSNAYERIRGWLERQDFLLRFPEWSCGPDPAACEAQTDADECGRLGCFWAPAVRVGITEADRCLGWGPEPVALCLAPNPYLVISETGNSFEGSVVRRFYYETSVGFHVVELTVSPYARFHSAGQIGPGSSWGECHPYTGAQVCACGD